MNLYHVSLDDELRDYDRFDEFVVCAPDEETARNTNPSDGSLMSPKDWETHRSWGNSPETVTVRLIGVAVPGLEPGIICSSYLNA